MRVIVTSDSHGNTDAVEQLMQANSFGIFIFCGDGTGDFDAYKLDPRLKIVKGNCDYFSPAESELILTVCGKKIFVTHGNKYFVKTSTDKLQSKAKDIGANIVFFGHTHKQKCFEKDGIYFVNPGALQNGQYAILDIDESGSVTTNLHKENI